MIYSEISQNKQTILHTMSVELLESSNVSHELTEQDFIDDATTKEQQRRFELRERICHDAELCQVIGDIASIRKANGDPNFTDVDIDILTDYDSFEAAFLAGQTAFDFRTKEDGSYGERWEAVERAEKYLMANLTPEQEKKIFSALELFTLVGDTEPDEPEAEAAIVLGGGGKSPLERTADIKKRIDNGSIRVQRVIGLGSERKVDAAERERAGEYAKDAETEFDLVVAAFEDQFNITIEPDDITTITTHTEYDVPRVHKLVAIPENFRGQHPELIITSSGILTNPFFTTMRNGKQVEALRNRANTDDTFKLLTLLKLFKPGDKLFVSTQAHFAPFQGQSAANEFAKQGIYAQVLGFQPKAPKKVYELLQESVSFMAKLRDVV